MLRALKSVSSPPRAFALLALIPALLAQASAPAGATTLVELDDDELIDGSALIVTGTCDGVATEWRDGVLMTVAAVEVDRVLKGERLDRLELLVPGGVDMDRAVPIAVTFPGAPSVTPGERVLLFLTPAGDDADRFAVTGLFQGKFSIVESTEGVPMIRRDLAGVSLARGAAVRAGDQRAVPLEVLEERIARRTGHASPGGDR